MLPRTSSSCRKAFGNRLRSWWNVWIWSGQTLIETAVRGPNLRNGAPRAASANRYQRRNRAAAVGHSYHWVSAVDRRTCDAVPMAPNAGAPCIGARSPRRARRSGPDPAEPPVSATPTTALAVFAHLMGRPSAFGRWRGQAATVTMPLWRWCTRRTKLPLLNARRVYPSSTRVRLWMSGWPPAATDSGLKFKRSTSVASASKVR